MPSRSISIYLHYKHLSNLFHLFSQKNISSVVFHVLKMIAQSALHNLEIYHSACQSLSQASYLASTRIWLKVLHHNKGLRATFQRGDALPSLLDLSQLPGLHLHLNSSSLPASFTRNYYSVITSLTGPIPTLHES